MKSLLILMLVLSTCFAYSAESKNSTKTSQTKLKKPIPAAIVSHELFNDYKKEYKSKTAIENLKVKTLNLKQKAMPLLTYVMKSSEFPDKNRWLATFMVGRIMGKKSANFLSKFAYHPNWMLRLASLKALLALKQVQFKGIYTRLLKDEAMIVRLQALENIRVLDLKGLAPYVWSMLYDKKNYSGDKGTRRRGEIVKTIIKTMGDLEFSKAKKPMLTMIQNKKYKDIHEELDYALEKVTGKSSPEGDITLKKHFWRSEGLKETTI